jgi:cellulose synthase/poly-beta-1,6-N-acetylglucosamine synthase-like glycosyltransferase
MGAKHPQIKLIDFRQNQGRGAARAAGVKAATGDFIAFVDADIVLPTDWLSRCLHVMEDQTIDMCGGIAVPDGDVVLVHRWFTLTPKVTAHSTTVTGSNGLFRKHVFEAIHFNASKKNGEDVDLGHQISASGLHGVSVPGLVVDHREMKNYRESVKWLWQSGRGASKQFYEHHEVRLPDLAFFGFAGLLVAAIVAVALGAPVLPALLALALYMAASSALHMFTKFRLLATPFRSCAAIIVNMSLLGAYYCGRALGMATEWSE